MSLLLPDAEEPTSEDTLKFTLNIKCTKNNVSSDVTDPDRLYKNHRGTRVILIYYEPSLTHLVKQKVMNLYVNRDNI